MPTPRDRDPGPEHWTRRGHHRGHPAPALRPPLWATALAPDHPKVLPVGAGGEKTLLMNVETRGEASPRPL